MNYNTDKPIISDTEDMLGRASFANRLGKALYDYNGNDGLVVGLFGKWGTGKTSVINMAINHIDILSENNKNKPLIIKFSPWNYSDKDNLISLFFQCLKRKIEIQDNEELKKKVGKALNDYAGAFDALSLVPLVGSGVAALVKTLAQVQGSNLMKEADLDKTKEALEKALIEVNRKIIVVIDDIDRLTNSQIRDVFQLVKQVADLPNVIYVLAMDRSVVQSALSEVHNIDGNEYLEKIIQIPFEIPELRKSRLNNIFFSKLEQVISEIPDPVVWDKDYWDRIFRNCVEPYINTLRDVNRVVNTFQFRYGMLYQETSFEDMLALTTIEVLEPELYKWICNNKDAVCGGILHGFLSGSENKTDYRKMYSEEFVKLGLNSDLTIRCISTMFPIFSKDVGENCYAYVANSDIKGKMRVASEGRFELYFMFDLDDIRVPRNLINAFIHKYEREELMSFLNVINSQGNMGYFIDEMRSLLDSIPQKRLGVIASVLLDMQGGFAGEVSKALFTVSVCDSAVYLAEDIIKRIDLESERYEIIRSTIRRGNMINIGSTAHFINGIELSYGRLASNSEKKDNQIISLEHLEEIEKEYVIRIADLAKDSSFIHINNFNVAFYLWECFDKEGAKVFLYELFKNDIDILKYICALAGKWHGTRGTGWQFYTDHFSEHISADKVYELIEKFDKSRLEEFSEIEQVKLASFVLNHNRDEMDQATEEEALRLIDEWKKKRDK